MNGNNGLPCRAPLFTILLALFLAPILRAPFLNAQTVEDGIMISAKKYCTGVFDTYDYYNHYWEGSLNRVNGNFGTLTTRTVSYIGNYGVTDHLDLLIAIPYVYTSASQGPLAGQRGFQDLTLGAKVKAVSLPIRQFGALRLFAAVSASLPMTDYTPDDEPLSIGTHSKQIAPRATLNYLGRNGLYLNGSTSYNFRNNVTLDRSVYFTDNQLYLSNQVAMPNQFEYSGAAGYRKNDTTLTFNYTEQQTRGGGDIRPQDIPFVSNRVNFQRVGATLTYPLPRVRAMQFWFIYNNTIAGRNVGQSNTFTTGFLYTIDFHHKRASAQ